jgi:hypothetical protein
MMYSSLQLKGSYSSGHMIGGDRPDHVTKPKKNPVVVFPHHIKRCNTLWLACLTALLFMLSPPLLYKHCFPALAAVLLLPLPCPLYLSLCDAYLGRLCLFLAPPSESPSDHPILLLYKHPSWRGVRQLYLIPCYKTINIYNITKLFLKYI